jgi:hypothetical protein
MSDKQATCGEEVGLMLGTYFFGNRMGGVQLVHNADENDNRKEMDHAMYTWTFSART